MKCIHLKKQFLLVFLLTSITCFSKPIQSGKLKKPVDINSDVEYKIYFNYVDNYKIDFPEKWDTTVNSEMNMITVKDVDSVDRTKFKAIIELSVRPNTGNSIDQIADEALKLNAENNSENFSKTKGQSISGVEYVKLSGQRTSIHYSDRTRFYMLNILILEKDKSKYDKIMEHVINSFTILN